MNKFEFKNLTPFKWFVLENFPFIEEDFDAITNWQLFCKLGKEINKVIIKTNELGTQVENLTNYIDNLDIQDEVNNKLDEMAEDGTLAELINQEIFSQINNDLNILKKKIDYKEIKPIEAFYYDLEENIQGGCIDNNYIYIYSLTSNTSGTLRKFNIVSKTLVSTIENVELYHGNGMTIINNLLYSADFYDENNNFSKGITIYNLNDGTTSHINPLQNENISRCYGITKLDENNLLVATSTTSSRLISESKFYKLNINDFSYVEIPFLINNFPNYNFDGSLLCDIIFKNNRLFILSSYPGQIFQFDYDEIELKLNKIYNIPSYDENGIAYGEFEGIENFENNYYGEDTFAFHSNSGNCLQVYLFNIESDLSPFAQPLYENAINNRTNLYLKKSSTSLYENGTITYPFKSIERAISGANNNKNINSGDILILDNENYIISSNHRHQKIQIRWDGYAPSITFLNTNPFVGCNVNFRTDDTNVINLYKNASGDRIFFNDSRVYMNKCKFNFGINISRGSNVNINNSSLDLETALNNAIVVDSSSIANLDFSEISGFNTNAISVRTNSIVFLNSYINSLHNEVNNNCFKFPTT